MREYSFQIDLNSGLRPYSEWKRGAKGLIECYNLVPRHSRLEPYENIVEPVVNTMNWPFPQLAIGSDYIYLLGEDLIQDVSSTWVLGTSVSTVSGGRWSFCDFGDFCIFTNGSAIYTRDYSTGLVTLHDESLIPYASTMCNFKGQLIAGNVHGYDENEVVWSSIGWANFIAASDSMVVGKRKLPWNGTIISVKRLGDQVIVYSSNGVALMSPTYVDVTPAFKFDEAINFGVVAVGGSIQSQLALGTNGKLWKFAPGQTAKELGYEEFFASMVDDDVVIAHDAERDEFYIGNGVKSYLLTVSGLCEIHEIVSDCIFFSGALIGIVKSRGDLSAYCTTNVFDMNLGGRKTLESIDVACKGSNWIATAYGSNRRGSFAYERSSPVNLEGMASVRMTAQEFKVRVKNPSYLQGSLDYMNIHYKLVDKRFKRSPYANQATPGADQ
jgi:hypothetical protein